ncbi:DTW domain-containing protein [Ferrimonas sediminicola]|uniref:tRNA-uridine aminocarboxypropyltransferase n=1 Tax=Ferrimonas sediminicola TaxID=2569538 RepID=A0A4U1BBR5_9GAMM|nr:DTW domain-containing protein [Ferrimonas sediminicola]TKB47610.1 DTW domain-containing protein [Ferrimonas sediminicola]
MDNAVLTLRARLVAQSSKPYQSRGATVARCPRCQIAQSHCACRYRLPQRVAPAFCLIMHRKEPMKPTNTGRLIAEILPDTAAFVWDRTEPDPQMLAYLADPRWQPYLVFPDAYVDDQPVVEAPLPCPQGKRPLFVLLDATWAQARKIYFKSPYLKRMPVLSINPERLSNYKLREAVHHHQLATAEVAAMVLELAGEPDAAEVMDAFFQVFSRRYYAGKHQLPVPSDGEAFDRLAACRHK